MTTKSIKAPVIPAHTFWQRFWCKHHWVYGDTISVLYPKTGTSVVEYFVFGCSKCGKTKRQYV